LRKILPGPKQEALKKKEGVEVLSDFNEDDLNTDPKGGKGKHKQQYDDDDDGQGGKRVECKSQWEAKNKFKYINLLLCILN